MAAERRRRAHAEPWLPRAALLLACGATMLGARWAMRSEERSPSVCIDWLEECRSWSVCDVNASAARPPRHGHVTAGSCGAESGHRLVKHVLVVHEQHPQALGCDRRLLSLIQLLQNQGRQVSMLYRRDASISQQSPPTAALAARLGIRDYQPWHLRSCLQPPPGLYKYVAPRQVQQLAAQGWFELVLVSVWFWNDPAPAFAEMVLPLLRAHSPPHRQPFVALLVDDAHAVRASRLALGESDHATRDAYNRQAAALLPRLRTLYAYADVVTHVSAEDQRAERAIFSNVRRWLLLRTPLRVMRALPKHAAAPHRQFGHTRHIGFLGNGQTATNHQAIEWFLSHCWPALRRAFPQLRLRLVGRPPGSRVNASGVVRCDPSVAPGTAHCGWAWGTAYSGVEAQNGIDELGFYDAEALLAEALSWRIFIAPIHATTGINTKLLLALELGIPIVVSAAAAAPLELGTALNWSASSAASPARAARPATIADTPEAFIAAVKLLYGRPEAWKEAVAAARLRFRVMMEHDPAADDMNALLLAACEAPPDPRGWKELRFVTAGVAVEMQLPLVDELPLCAAESAELATERSGSPKSRAAGRSGKAGGGRGGRALPPTPQRRRTLLVLGAAGESALPAASAALVHRVWGRLCKLCTLSCYEQPEHAPLAAAANELTGGEGFRSVAADTHVWLDAVWPARIADLRSLPAHRYRALRFYRAGVDGLAREPRGVRLDAASGLEELLLPLPVPACYAPAAGQATALREIHALGGEDAVWREAFRFARVAEHAVDAALEFAREEAKRASAGCMHTS